jgi:hypothetical protein
MKRDERKIALRCAVYTRVSTDSGLEQDFNSLDNQREASEAYIKSADAYVVARVSVRRSLWLADTERKSKTSRRSRARSRQSEIAGTVLGRL